MRFGTPGYRCPAYGESGEYDATSEIYSLGVVLAELLRAARRTRTASSTTGTLLRKRGLAADERAGQWPAELVLLVAEWSRLVASCVAGPAKRLARVPIPRAAQPQTSRFLSLHHYMRRTPQKGKYSRAPSGQIYAQRQICIKNLGSRKTRNLRKT